MGSVSFIMLPARTIFVFVFLILVENVCVRDAKVFFVWICALISVVLEYAMQFCSTIEQALPKELVQTPNGETQNGPLEAFPVDSNADRRSVLNAASKGFPAAVAMSSASLPAPDSLLATAQASSAMATPGTGALDPLGSNFPTISSSGNVHASFQPPAASTAFEQTQSLAVNHRWPNPLGNGTTPNIFQVSTPVLTGYIFFLERMVEYFLLIVGLLSSCSVFLLIISLVPHTNSVWTFDLAFFERLWS